MKFPRYDRHQSYNWNVRHAPDVVVVDEPAVPGMWTFCGRTVASPLGIAAGPLLNGRWCLYYAALGFDVVTYKTVRSSQRDCYPLPNLLPVTCGQLVGGEQNLPASDEFAGSWAVSFGMPSQPPEVWTADVAETRRRLAPHKLLCVSVVGTMQSDWSIERLAEDYASCAQDAAASGADSVEINLSCPNVRTCDGQLYRDPQSSKVVTCAVRQAIGELPLIVKTGHFRKSTEIGRLVDAIAGDVSAIATTNSVAATVIDAVGRPYFDGQPRGICGAAILDASVRQAAAMAEYIARHSAPLSVIGVGGALTADDVRRYLSAGAEGVHLATAAMTDPEVGIKIRTGLQDEV